MIRKFESFNKGLPKIGDYVFCDEVVDGKPDDLDIFFSSNIGIIIDTSNQYKTFFVKYENVPDKILKEFWFEDDGSRKMSLSEIEFWSSDRDEVEMYINSKKYNL